MTTNVEAMAALGLVPALDYEVEMDGWTDVIPPLSAARRPYDGGMRLRVVHEKRGTIVGYLNVTAARYFADRGLPWIRVLARGEEIMLRGESAPDAEHRCRKIRTTHGGIIGSPQFGIWPHGTIVPLTEYREGRLVGIPQPPVETGDK